MSKFKKPEIEIFHFQCNDIITASLDHDNGFIDTDELVRAIKNIVEDIF